MTLLKTLLTLLAALPAIAQAQAIAMVTIVDGPALLLRGHERFALAEAVRLEAGDIVETAKDALLLRVEFGAGEVLDLGPDSRALLAPAFARERRERPRTAYLAQGWAKLTLGRAGAEGQGIAAAGADLLAQTGVTVLRASGADLVAFQESGASAIAEAAAPRNTAPRALGAGQSFTLVKGKAQVLPRVEPALAAALPTSFRDTLPLRAARFKDVNRPPRALPAPGYDDLATWLQSERTLRMALMPRWQGLEAQPEFRRALVRNLPAHPEWRPILFPPPPKPASAPPSAPIPPAATLPR